MYCHRCRTENPDYNNYCNKCGGLLVINQSKSSAEAWSSKTGSLVGGISIIIVGIAFLTHNIFHNFYNWWAIFLFIPVVVLIANIYNSYKKGRKINEAISSFLGAVIIAAIAILFLLNVALGALWPLILIAGGIAIILGTLGNKKSIS